MTSGLTRALPPPASPLFSRGEDTMLAAARALPVTLPADLIWFFRTYGEGDIGVVRDRDGRFDPVFRVLVPGAAHPNRRLHERTDGDDDPRQPPGRRSAPRAGASPWGAVWARAAEAVEAIERHPDERLKTGWATRALQQTRGTLEGLAGLGEGRVSIVWARHVQGAWSELRYEDGATDAPARIRSHAPFGQSVHDTRESPVALLTATVAGRALKGGLFASAVRGRRCAFRPGT